MGPQTHECTTMHLNPNLGSCTQASRSQPTHSPLITVAMQPLPRPPWCIPSLQPSMIPNCMHGHTPEATCNLP